MNIARLGLGLTVVNLALLVLLLACMHPTVARDGAAGVLRGSALQIVDDHGRVRASIVVQPEDRAHPLPDGSPRPDNVILRLLDSNGRPCVKLGGSTAEAALALIGVPDAAHAILKAEGSDVFLKLATPERQQVVKP